mmetsp:Transcript_31029/g.73264  ORF Transcript_31029/g.73264 Transcript_31029/m.73264 type:complete len:246 (-) Transcript_31029:133-870(-)
MHGRRQPRPHPAGTGHLLIESSVDRCRVCGAPVRHDPPLEAQPLLKVALQRLGVFARPDAPDPVVRAHDRADARLDCRFEGRIVEFELRAFVDHLAHARSRGLLVVVHPVLGVGDDPLRLDPPHHGRHEDGSQVRVLARDVLEVAAVARDTRQAHARPELHVGTLAIELGAHPRAPLARRLRVEGGADGEGARPCGRAAQVLVVAKALRPVVHLERRDAQPRVLAHVTDVARDARGASARAMEEG